MNLSYDAVMEGKSPEAQSVVDVQAQQDRLQAVKAEWTGKLEQAGADLADLEQTAGADVLAGVLAGEDSASSTIDRLTRARVAVDVARQTLRAIEAKEVELAAHMTLARSAEVRKQAEAKRAELDSHNAQLRPLLEKLQELDCGVYEPQQPPRIVGGTLYVVEGYVEHTHTRLGRELADLEQNAQMLELNARGNFAAARRMAAAGVDAARRPQRRAAAH